MVTYHCGQYCQALGPVCMHAQVPNVAGMQFFLSLKLCTLLRVAIQSAGFLWWSAYCKRIVISSGEAYRQIVTFIHRDPPVRLLQRSAINDYTLSDDVSECCKVLRLHTSKLVAACGRRSLCTQPY